MQYFKDKFDLTVVDKLVEDTLTSLSTNDDNEKREILSSIIINCYYDGYDHAVENYELMMLVQTMGKGCKNKID